MERTLRAYEEGFISYTGATQLKPGLFVCLHPDLSPEYPLELYSFPNFDLCMLSEFLWEGRDTLTAYERGMGGVDALNLFLEGVTYTPDTVFMYCLLSELITPALPEGATLRPLKKIRDAAAMRALKASCTAKETAEGAVSLSDAYPMGAFNGKTLVSAATCWLWGESLADLGVLTHGKARGQGYGRAATAASAEAAMKAGRLPLYRFGEGNAASKKLAESLGFTLLARGEGAQVHYPDTQ